MHSLIRDTQDASAPFRILSLDGGGAKGFYTLGLLMEIEAMLGAPLHSKFDLIFGTSTGSIIAALLALGFNVEQIVKLYKNHVPLVMSNKNAASRSAALRKLATEVFGNSTFEDFETGIGIVSTNWMTEMPMIFKNRTSQAYGRKATFVPGFGVSVADAVTASCSAYPFFERTVVRTSNGELIDLIDGGYCANNPALYAIADAVKALQKKNQDIRLVSLGVGSYPEPKKNIFMSLVWKYIVSVQLLQKTLDTNTRSMDKLRTILFSDIPTIRISDSYSDPSLATDLLESDVIKLNQLLQLGRESFAKREQDLRNLLA